MATDASFSGRLAAMVSMEMAEAHGDAERIGVVLERLAHALGFSIAMASRGNAEAINDMLEGASAYLYEAAADNARIARFMADVRNQRPAPDGGQR